MRLFAPLIALVFVSTACVQRDLSPLNFACDNGGACDDAGEMGRDAETIDEGSAFDAGSIDAESEDASAPDGAPIDSGPVDTGVIPPSCTGAMILPADGVVHGNTTQSRDDFNASCSLQMGGKDQLFAAGWPGDLSVLDVSTLGTTFDTVLYAFRTDCNVTSELRCNDDRAPGIDLTSRIHVRNIARGQYFFVVDGYDPMSYGPFTLTVSGIIAQGQPCDPNLSYLTCEKGSCLPDTGGSICKEPKDCLDGIDNNENGTTDEDASSCHSPPVVTCPPMQSAMPGTSVQLIGRAMSSSRIAAQGWTMTRSPGPTLPVLAKTADAATASVTLALAGQYVLRYTAIDDGSQAVACETTINVAPNAELRVEAYWDPPELALLTDLDLHLLTETATAWFSHIDDCYPATCTMMPLAWGARAEGDAAGQGPESILVAHPLDGTSYRVGVHYYSSDLPGSATAYVRVFCHGNLHDVGSAVLPTGNVDPNGGNSFWKAADVTLSASDCTVTKLVDSMSQPLIITATVAHHAR